MIMLVLSLFRLKFIICEMCFVFVFSHLNSQFKEFCIHSQIYRHCLSTSQSVLVRKLSFGGNVECGDETVSYDSRMLSENSC